MTRRPVFAAAMALLGLLYVSPVIWMLLAAFKSRPDALATPPKLFFTPTLEHFRSLFTGVTVDGTRLFATGFERYVVNSVAIAMVSVALSLLLGGLAAYGFSRRAPRGGFYLLFHILVLRMMPPLVTIIPLYVIFSRIGLGGSYVGIVLVYTAFNLPFAIWMLKSFFDELPLASEEAARLDGSTLWRILWRVCLPQMGGGIAATAVIALVFTWNDFLFAQMLTGADTRTLPVAMLRVMGADVGTDWGVFAAIGTITLIPVLAVTFFLQEQLLRGVTFGTLRR